MKHKTYVAKFAALVAALSIVGCTHEKAVVKAKVYAPHTVIANQFVFSGAVEPVDQALKERGIQASFERLDPKETFYLVNYKGKESVNDVLAAVTPLTEWAEPNFQVQPVSSFRKSEWPTDKFFFKQWALNNIGQAAPFGLPGARGADMDVLRVWDKVTKGSDKVVVAVIDTGCDYTHPDLKANVWVNAKESEANGGIPGKDDDGNGYIDDVYGYDFTSSDRTSYKGFPGDSDPMDEDGHGTHCAGSIGASPNNGVGIAGLNWNVKIMCVKFLNANGGSSVDAFRAVRYARENGASIMSNSWGGTGEQSELFKTELRKMQEKGILFVAASGNDGANTDINKHYPSGLRNAEFRGKRFDNVLSVGASDNQDAPAEFSNYGAETVDVFAPGVAIVSTYPTGLVENGRPPYANMSGTSMATPYVAGVAALMMAANPSLVGKASEVIRLINATADVKPTLIGKAVSSGRINAYKAVTADAGNKELAPIWQAKSHVIDQRGFHQELVDIRHQIKVDGAKWIKVHFDFVQLQAPYDSIYLYDKDYRLIASVDKNLVDDLWSPAIPGDTVHVRFVNALLQQIQGVGVKLSSESACVSRGASMVTKAGDEYRCEVDSEDGESGGGSKKYSSNNSEGFRIDQVSYVVAENQGQTPPQQGTGR